MQIKPKWDIMNWLSLKRLEALNVDETVEQISYISNESVYWWNHLNLEIFGEFAIKLKIVYPGNIKTCPCKDFYVKVYSSFIHNGQHWETILNWCIYTVRCCPDKYR